jgi:hypothetical protein
MPDLTGRVQKIGAPIGDSPDAGDAGLMMVWGDFDAGDQDWLVEQV